MKSEFIRYMQDIGVSTTLIEEIRIMHSVAHRLLGEEIDTGFISDVKDQGGVRNYQYVFFFSEHRFARLAIPNNAEYYVFGWEGLFPAARSISENYDFWKADEKSKLQMVLATEGLSPTHHRQVIIFQATGNNCDYLLKIYTERILPHL